MISLKQRYITCFIFQPTFLVLSSLEPGRGFLLQITSCWPLHIQSLWPHVSDYCLSLVFFGCRNLYWQKKSPFLQILMCWYPKIFSFYFLRLLTNVVEFKSFKVSFPHRPQATSSLGHTGCYLLFVSVSLSIYSSITCHPNTVSSHWILLSEKVTLYIYL